MKPQMIAFLTDFGSKDTYVAQMKASVFSIKNDAIILDLTHEVAAQNIKQAAFLLLSSYRYFPKGSIFVTVVDPGVGTSRKAIIADSDGYYFIAPDNGLLSQIVNKKSKIYLIENKEYMNDYISNTFHGRDIFAPAAAHLLNGEELHTFGKEISYKDIEKLNINPITKDNTLEGEILHIDHYGNCISNISKDSINFEIKSIKIKDVEISNIDKTYSNVEPGQSIAYFGSSNYLELAKRDGNFAKDENIFLNQKIIVRI